jgi:2-hydroxy-3-oxopropionate reductase
MTTPVLAVIGVGLMGKPIVCRLLAAGFPVRVWNRTHAKAAELERFGARVAETPEAAARGADIVIMMLENGKVATAVLFEMGLAEGLKHGSLLIDMGSIPPAVAREHGQSMANRGVRYLDAPVSGGTVGAEQGTLAIMVGGEAGDFEEAVPIFACLGRATLVGPRGSGQLAKLANQIIVTVTIGAVAEGLMLAAAGGADPGAVRDALRGGYAESRVLEVLGQRMVDRDYISRGAVHVQVKDLETVLATAKELGLTLPLAVDVRNRYVQLRDELGGSELDHSALMLQIEALNKPYRVERKTR